MFGDSDDWLYKDGHTYALLVEAFSPPEGLVNFHFYSTTAAGRDALTAHNFRGALTLIRTRKP